MFNAFPIDASYVNSRWQKYNVSNTVSDNSVSLEYNIEAKDGRDVFRCDEMVLACGLRIVDQDDKCPGAVGTKVFGPVNNFCHR